MTTQTLYLINEYLMQGGYTPGIDAETLEREAALVAAAPDLLAALEKVQDWLDGCSNIYTVQRYVTDALNKAKGN